MKQYEAIKDIDAKDFKRLTGIRRETFKKMFEVVVKHEEARKRIIGRPQKLRYEDQIFYRSLLQFQETQIETEHNSPLHERTLS